MGCGCSGGPVQYPAFTNATTAKYSPDGYLAWWWDSGRLQNVNIVLNNYCLELSYSLGGTPIISELDHDGVLLRTVTVAGHVADEAMLFVVNGALLCLSVDEPSIGSSYTCYATRFDPDTFATVWTFSAAVTWVTATNLGTAFTIGSEDEVYVHDRVGGVDKVHKYTAGILTWTINASDPGGGSNIYGGFGRKFQGADMAWGGSAETGWLYNGTPAIIDRWDPGTATVHPHRTFVDSSGMYVWANTTGNAVYRLDSELNETFAPASTFIGSLYVDGSSGSLYGMSNSAIYRCSTSGTITTRVSGGASLSDFLLTGDQSSMYVRDNAILRKYDDSAAPATLLWTINPTFIHSSRFYRSSLSVDATGALYVSGQRRTASTLDKIPS